jgi:hypothetical protein
MPLLCEIDGNGFVSRRQLRVNNLVIYNPPQKLGA